MKSTYLVILVINVISIINSSKVEKSSQENVPTQMLRPSPIAIGCGCASQMPPCCSPELQTFQCDCAPKPECGGCPMESNMFVNLHDNMLKLAMKDAYNQQDLAQKAKLQVDLFQKAQEYAKEVGVQEMKAKQFANVLNEATRKAQFSRAMMFQAATQVRILADQTIKAIQPMKCIGSRCGINNMGMMMPPELANPMQQQAQFILNQTNNLRQP